ncbi:NB-ARC domain-containing protein [Laspinema olomoucense]|uniref:NB-ARC domain-containing protein n=1 Tax=Laspinema olomoucense TaxID=3231600 RepID=UPI0021BB8115|nr:NB-ARC domain-containing protein [Laspinema sp. D3c]MCT7994060.1 NB-ARC domain-containing protein [Laspinema sp. D3c]
MLQLAKPLPTLSFMTIAEVLQLVDRLVEQQRGKHLNDLEKTVVQGLWQGQTYSQISDKCGYDENYIGDVSRQIFKQLSEELNEDIKKSNFCWTIERVINSQFVGLVNSPINWCTPHHQTNPNPSIADQEDPNNQTRYSDLTLAPKITQFYDRTLELQTLSDWILVQNTRLISVVGLPGIGKTTLVKRFVDLNLQQFDAVIWKSIKIEPSLNTLITEFLTKVAHADLRFSEINLLELFKALKTCKTLLILDDIQELFKPRKLAGQYQSRFQEYKTLFQRLGEIEHNSHLILISQEQCQEMIGLTGELAPVQMLKLPGLTQTSILSDRGLKDPLSWSQLIEQYEGHPVYLQEVADLIKTMFSGKVSDFLAEEGIILTANMKSQLGDIFNRLSPLEQQIMVKLSQSPNPMSKTQLKQELDLSLMDLINGLESLNRRHLLKTSEAETVLFDGVGLMQEYIRSLSID